MTNAAQSHVVPYAQGRVFFDADSHIMETLDWLHSHATPSEAALIAPLSPKNAGLGVEKAIAKAEARRNSPEATAELLQQPLISGPKGWFAYGASTSEERTAALNLLGFEKQLVFPTFSLGQFIRSEDEDVLYAGAHALNRGMARFCASDPRMLSVGYLPLQNVARSLKALEEGLREGVNAFWVSANCPAGRSPAHLDHEPIWATLAQHRVPVILHIGAGTLSNPALHNNGRPAVQDWLGGGENLRAKDWPASAHSAQSFLTALVLDGVFERHPELRCGVIELGGSWLPGFMRLLDQAAHQFRKSEPLLEQLTRKPSEYLRRQVRVSLFPFEDAGWLIKECGEELLMFASDYPHPEGGRDPIGRFESSLNAHGIAEPARARFYQLNFADLMRL
jgi:predicted TIM-barrel fold metal-dependent hydrolase